MNAISKVSDITAADVAEYIRLDEVTLADTNALNMMIASARSYMRDTTGRTDEEIDTYPDFVIACFVLVQDMWDNRALYVDKNTVNKTVETILGSQRVNFL